MFVDLKEVLDAIRSKGDDKWGTAATDAFQAAVLAKTKRFVSLSAQATALSDAIDLLEPNVKHMSIEDFTEQYREVSRVRAKMDKLLALRIETALGKYKLLKDLQQRHIV